MDRTHLNGSIILRLVAFLLFLIAAILVAFHATSDAPAWMVPAGLAAWVLGTLVP